MPRPRSPEPQAPLAPSWPRLATLRAAIVYAIAVLLLVYPAFGGKFLVNAMSDQLNGTPYRIFASAMIRETGAMPLWNPYILGGLPFVAGQHGDTFYPTFIARMFFSADHVLTWSFAIHLFLAGLFTFQLLRALRVGFAGSLVGGAAYMLGGQIASLVSPGHDGKMYVSALTPLILWMIVRGVRDGRWYAWGVLALATGLSILSPHMQMTYYTGVLAGAFTLFLAFRKSEDPLDGRTRVVRLALALGAAAVGFAIASIHFLPFFEYIPYSPRQQGGRGWEYAILFSMPPEELLNAYLPQFSGIIESYWGRNALKLHSEYIGASVLVLAGAAFGSARRSFLWFWTGVLVVGLLWAFGGFTPFYRLVYALPMMSVVRAPGMIYYIPTLACAVLAALGTERLLARERGTRYLLGWGAAAVLIAVLAAAGFFTGVARAIVPPEHAGLETMNAGAVAIGGLRSLAFVALTIASIALWWRGRLPARVLPLVLVGIVVVDLWSVDRLYFRWLPSGSQVYGSDAAIEYLQKLPEPGRVIVLGQPPFTNDADAILNGDGMMAHRVRTVTGHQANELQRWVELAGGKSPAPGRNILNPLFWRLANARFIYTNGELPEQVPELPGIRFLRRVGPVPNAAGNRVNLYEIVGIDAPAAWTTTGAIKAPAPQVLAASLDPRFDPRSAALFDDSSRVNAAAVSVMPPASRNTVRLTTLQPGHIVAELGEPAAQGSTLVVSENYYPGWSARVDGAAALIDRADYTFIGVPLPAGARRVELTFTERAYERGKTLTLIALAIAAIWSILGAVLQGRKRTRSVSNG